MYCSWLSNNGVFENTLKLLNIALCYNAIHTCTVSVMVVFSLSLSLQMLVQQLEGLKISSKATLLSRFKQIFDQMWMQNGDNISKLYAGTRALGSSSKVSPF